MRRLGSVVVAVVLVAGGFVLAASPAGAAGIVTHSWMGLDAIDNVHAQAFAVEGEDLIAKAPAVTRQRPADHPARAGD